MEERRRFPRRSVDRELASVPVSEQVRVIDISSRGVLLHTTTPLGIGTKAALRLSLWGEPFSAEVEIQRVWSVDGPAAGYRVGAKFLAVSADHLHVIERFIAE